MHWLHDVSSVHVMIQFAFFCPCSLLCCPVDVILRTVNHNISSGSNATTICSALTRLSAISNIKDSFAPSLTCGYLLGQRSGGTSRKSQSGAKPCFALCTSRRSCGMAAFTRAAHESSRAHLRAKHNPAFSSPGRFRTRPSVPMVLIM